MKAIYLDHAATTPLSEEVLEAMIPIYNDIFGNPSSVHSFGRKARQILDNARRTIADSIHANEKDIIFTSGATEANNLALIGTAKANRNKGNHIITTEQEHHAVLHAAEYLEEEGFNVTYLPINKDGKISINDLKNALTDDTILVSVMYVNNETGVIQPINEIADALTEADVIFHTDAVQAFGLIDINVETLKVDLLSVSSHKINGPKGIGFLYTRENIPIYAQLYGGEQERKRRPGTENMVGIVGFQKAVELVVKNRNLWQEQYKQYKEAFLAVLKNEKINFEINGDPKSMIPSTINLSFPGINVEKMLMNLDIEGVAASSGSACTAGSIDPSHVLVAMFGKDTERTQNSIRFSFGIHNTLEDVEEAARRLAKIVHRLTRNESR
ncbi:cysteine desulfurase [Virgibacillus sp. MSJ-26]|uniref:cysteine desulfurase family protein n=1 Tax=Virgibacillus sp. MSJ-26 TaxID=2841522 RepID=UPI001C0FD765|nr:cysteine desulfurase family protein [Virgibacillus sp. MSJ-26]MBU5466490.1 cysteine desulfurase [Virgibacillus sp. MSJ-26]